MNDTLHQIRTIEGIDCMSGNPVQLSFLNNRLEWRAESQATIASNCFIGPGLVDLQINGVNGIDFNNPALTTGDVINATLFLLSQGVTTFFPTVITNDDDTICALLATIDEACRLNPLVASCIAGIHLEGPFISPVAGARGAHDEQFIKAPDLPLFQRFQRAAAGRIKLVTIAPEWENAEAFITACRAKQILVSIGHSMADPEAISRAVKAGASLSTHLGNGVPLVLPRHPNIIWEQLATPQLYACIIADGIHIPDSMIQVIKQVKGDQTIVVSDATCFAGMLPGEYQNHIGGTVILDSKKRVSLKSTPGMLAGAAKTLLENVETLLQHRLCDLREAWQMASVNPGRMLRQNDGSLGNEDDLVLFETVESGIRVTMVVKAGRVVFTENGQDKAGHSLQW